MTRVAGHDLQHTARGLACVACERRWLDILDQKHRWRAHEADIAHAGTLNDREVGELFAFEAVYNARIWDAVSGRSSEVGEEVA